MIVSRNNFEAIPMIIHGRDKQGHPVLYLSKGGLDGLDLEHDKDAMVTSYH